MLERITDLKEKSNNPQVQAICESALASLSNVIYNNVTGDAKIEIENATMENMFNQLTTIEEDDVQHWVANGKRIFSVQNLGVREAINKLQESEGKENPSLNEFLTSFKPRLDEDPEVLLYEEFISGMQAFSYYPVIGSAVDAIADRVNSYKNDVNLNKILETMKKTRSSYLIPYIQVYVENYLNNKTEQNKSFLKEALIKFSYDPFVKDIISVVTTDSTDLQLEYASGECDIDKIYSPVIYIGENEAAFNVKGTFYIKKGNHVNRLPKEDLAKLDEEFVQLCNVLNSDNVEIIGENFNVYIGSDHALINDLGAEINGSKYGPEEFRRMAEAAPWAGNTEFIEAVDIIHRNLNEIAEVDFVKRVFLKEDENHTADIFKLRDNVFIATRNPAEGKNTFFRNVNPIQAKNIMMEHLRFDVSRLFESLLPKEEKIQEEISETKKTYVDYMTMLEGKIETFQHQNINETTKDVIDALLEELNEVRDEYKDYLNMVERYMLVPDDVDVSDLSEEIKLTIDVNGQRYVVPIPDGTGEGQPTQVGAEQTAGTVPGDDSLEDSPASAVTFDDDETELLGDSPSMQDDEVDLGAQEVEAEAEEAEEKAEAEKDAEDEDYEDEEGADLDFEEEAEEDEDQDKEVEKKKKKKKKKTEESNESLERDSFVEEGSDEPKKQKKVFLKKKKK